MAPETRCPYSSKPTTILQHLTHPTHPLHLLYIPKEFLCTGCDALGFGARYRCEICDFDLHEICATCPATAAAPLHPKHPLLLVNEAASHRACHICGDLVRGLFYTCRACNFDVHPLCTQLPLQVQLPLHPHHLLKLQPAAPAPCALCFKSCTSWRYRCDVCRLDLHVECALGAGSDDVIVQNMAAVSPPPSQKVGFPAGCGGGYGAYGMAAPPPVMVYQRQNSGKSRKRTYLLVARVAANVVSAFTGVPLNFF
ncbi:hypothetical protein C2S51_014521 [Perilla frutescens var. frutescens]|nr:hypothetical protein C2S51_014521 [Perilla frutescens var. frutescens]